MAIVRGVGNVFAFAFDFWNGSDELIVELLGGFIHDFYGLL